MIQLSLLDFLSGAITALSLVASLFFLRFWTRSRDGLFLAFATAFALLAAVQTMLTFTGMPIEERSWLYILRLIAFLIILVAIFGKNRRRPG